MLLETVGKLLVVISRLEIRLPFPVNVTTLDFRDKKETFTLITMVSAIDIIDEKFFLFFLYTIP